MLDLIGLELLGTLSPNKITYICKAYLEIVYNSNPVKKTDFEKHVARMDSISFSSVFHMGAPQWG